MTFVRASQKTSASSLRGLLFVVFLFQICGCLGIETTTTLVPTPTATPSSTVIPVVKNETGAKLNTTEKNNLNSTVRNILNTTAKTILNATAKSILNATAKSILNATAKSILNATAKSILNTTAKSSLNATAKSILNTTKNNSTVRSVLNATDKINLNITKKLNLTGATASPKLDEIVKKIDTSVDEIKKTTMKSWLMIRGIIFVISMYGIYKVYVTIQEMRQKKKDLDEVNRLILPGTPSAGSPKGSLHRSASSGFFATNTNEQIIRSKSPENNLRHRLTGKEETNKWHV